MSKDRSALKWKRNLYTGMGIVLSFSIAIGGWALTSMLIDNKSDALMSMTGYVTVNPPPITTPSQTDDDPADGLPAEWPRLTEVEMARILINWESTGHERPHEPMEGQLNMEQAIDAADACLAEWGKTGLLPVEWETYESVRASLCQNLPEGRRDMLDPVYSYWIISLANQDTRTVLTINAVTGQIWKASLSFAQMRVPLKEVDIEHALNTFMSQFDMGFDVDEPVQKIEATYEKNAAFASRYLPDNMVYATVTLLERDSGKGAFLSEIDLSLATAFRTITDEPSVNLTDLTG